VKKLLTLFFLFFISFSIYSQESLINISGNISVTNNGISLVPSFSLEKPASIINLNFSAKKLSFEPDLRFSLEGKPWSFLFWWRYKVTNKNSRFNLRIGAHPALNFKEKTFYTSTNNPITSIVARRFIATEVVPNFKLTNNISIGIYYLLSFGLDETVKKTNFLTFNSSFQKLKLSKDFNLSFTPQVYYLKMDDRDGFYFTSNFSLRHNKIPFSISSIINKELKSNIFGSKNFNWNLSLVYYFNILNKT